MSRHFTSANNDIITFSPGGAASIGTAGIAFAYLWRPTTVGALWMFRGTNASSTEIWSSNPYSDGKLYFALNGSGFTTGHSYVANTWYLTIFSKVTGTVAPRLHTYTYGVGWSHTNAPNNMANPTGQPVTSINVGRGNTGNTTEDLNGDVAAIAFFGSGPLIGASDAAVEAMGLETALSNWLTQGPAVLWAFNQANVATSVPDLSTTGTATQVSIAGTSIGSDPPGFSYSLGNTLISDSDAFSLAEPSTVSVRTSDVDTAFTLVEPSTVTVRASVTDPAFALIESTQTGRLSSTDSFPFDDTIFKPGYRDTDSFSIAEQQRGSVSDSDAGLLSETQRGSVSTSESYALDDTIVKVSIQASDTFAFANELERLGLTQVEAFTIADAVFSGKGYVDSGDTFAIIEAQSIGGLEDKKKMSPITIKLSSPSIRLRLNTPSITIELNH